MYLEQVALKSILVDHVSLPFNNQSGAWYAEAVSWAVPRKLEKIKTLLGFKKFSRSRSRRSLQWVTEGMSCKRSIYESKFIKVSGLSRYFKILGLLQSHLQRWDDD